LEQHDQAIHALIEELQENNRLDMAREQVVQDMQMQLAALSQRANQHNIFMSGLAIACAALATITALDLLNLL